MDTALRGLPNSGQILGWLLQVLDWKAHVLASKEGGLKRLARGEMIGPSSQQAIRLAIVTLLDDPDEGFAHPGPGTNGPVVAGQRPHEQGWAWSLEAMMVVWNRFKPVLDVPYVAVAESSFPATAIIRMLLPDLGLRHAAIGWLERGQPGTGLPAFNSKTKKCELLRFFRDSCVPRPTVADMARHCHVSPSRVDDWLRSDDRLAGDPGEAIPRLAELLSERMPGWTAKRIAILLKRHYAAISMREDMTKWVGGSEVFDWFLQHVRDFSQRCQDLWTAGAGNDPRMEIIARRCLMYGLHRPQDASLLLRLLEEEPEVEFQRDLTAWIASLEGKEDAVLDRMTECLYGLDPEARGPALSGNPIAIPMSMHQYGHCLPLPRVLAEQFRNQVQAENEEFAKLPTKDKIAWEHDQRALEMLLRGNSVLAVHAAGKAVLLTPDDPQRRWMLALALIGIRDFKPALLHMQQACRLAPTWDAPFEVVGELLIRLERWDEACTHLGHNPPSGTPKTNLWYLRGMAAFELGRLLLRSSPEKAERLRHALDSLEHCMGLDGKQPHRELPTIYATAAACAVEVGEPAKVTKYSRLAAFHGAPRVREPEMSGKPQAGSDRPR